MDGDLRRARPPTADDRRRRDGDDARDCRRHARIARRRRRRRRRDARAHTASTPRTHLCTSNSTGVVVCGDRARDRPARRRRGRAVIRARAWTHPAARVAIARRRESARVRGLIRVAQRCGRLDMCRTGGRHRIGLDWIGLVRRWRRRR